MKVFLPPVNTDEMLIPRMVCSLCLSLLGLVPLAHAVEFAGVENSRSASCFHPLVSLFNIRGKVKQRGGGGVGGAGHVVRLRLRIVFQLGSQMH